MQGGQQATQQFGQRGQRRFEESVPSEVRLAVEDLEKIFTVAEWAKTQAAQRGLHGAVRASNDIENLADLQKKRIVRQSPAASVVGQCVTRGLQQSIQELQQYAQEPAVQEELSKVQGLAAEHPAGRPARPAVQSAGGRYGPAEWDGSVRRPERRPVPAVLSDRQHPRFSAFVPTRNP